MRRERAITSRAERLTDLVFSILENEPQEIRGFKGGTKARAIIRVLETNGGYWLTAEEKELIKAIIKCY